MATLYNLIYYYPAGERASLLRTLGAHLMPGGRLVVTAPCRTNAPSMEPMDMRSSMTEGCGPLPDANQVNELPGEAGFADIRSESLIPGLYVYFATEP